VQFLSNLLLVVCYINKNYVMLLFVNLRKLVLSILCLLHSQKYVILIEHMIIINPFGSKRSEAES